MRSWPTSPASRATATTATRASDGREFIVIDTGGFEPDKRAGIVHEMAKQTRQAVAEADAVLFVVDVRAGLSAQDHDIARFLRSAGKRVLLAVNKAEGMSESPRSPSSTSSAWATPHPVSAAHGQGIRSLLDAALDGFDFGDAAADAGDEDADKPIRLAVAGRPNVGKSTLINTWLGEERLVAFDQPGTTRDAIHVPFERGGRHFELIDTAGLRRKGKVFEAIEKFSVVKTLQAIADANVVVLLLDATQGVTDQDAHIAGYILDSGRAVVVAVNKWDAVDAYQREMLERSIAQRLAFLRYAPVLHISAHEAPGPRRRCGRRSPRRTPRRTRQAAHAGADAAAARGGRAPGAQARRRSAARSCAMRTRAA